MVTLTQIIKMAENWLLTSGIQSEEGGLYAWFDADTEKYSFLHSESTGYFLSTMSFLYSRSPSNNVANATRKAFNFLEENAKGRVPLYRCRREPTEDSFGETYCLFDNGIILLGLTNILNSELPLDCLSQAKELGDAMVDIFQLKSEQPILRIKDGNSIIKGDRWSTQLKPHYLKAIAGLRQLGLVLNDNSYIDVAECFADRINFNYLEHGGLETSETDEKTYMHPFCYAIEGLHLLSRPYSHLVNWKRQCIELEQYLPAYFPNGAFIENLDTVAQSMRILIISSHKDSIESRILLDRILNYQNTDGNQQVRGGFSYSNHNPNHFNSWSTMFALQTLALYASNTTKVKHFV